MNFSYPLICLHDIFFRLPNHEFFSWISTLPLNAGTKPFRITESPAHRTPKPTNTDQQTIIITKKWKLKVLPQHATLTPPSATSTPEPNVQRKSQDIVIILPCNTRLLQILALYRLIASPHFSGPTPISIYNRQFKKNLSILISTLLTVFTYLTIVHDFIHIRCTLKITLCILENRYYYHDSLDSKGQGYLLTLR